MSVDPPTEPPHPRRAAFRAFPLRLIAVTVALGLIGFAAGYLGTWPPFATVMSGSMSPTIKTGDVVVLKRLSAPPRVGDIVQVSVPDDARSRYGYPPVVVHRVVRVSANGAINTKGDAKPRPDPFSVRRDAVSAKVVLHVPAAGRLFAFLVSPMGLLWIAGGALMFFVMPHLERRQEAEEAEQDALAAMHAELLAISEELARLRAEAAPAVAEPEPDLQPTTYMPAVDWTELETTPDPEPAAEPEPVPAPAPVTYVVRRRSGGLLGRLR